MTTSTFNLKPVLWSLVLAALAIAAIIVLSYSGGRPTHVRDMHPITLTQQSQTESHPPAGALGQDVPRSAAVGESPSTRPTGIGIQRFADAEPGTTGPGAQQAVPSCGPKRCPRPQ